MKHLLTLCCLLLCSCSTVMNAFEPDPIPVLNLPTPKPIKMEKVKFKILHKDNVTEYFKNIPEGVVFALTPQDYKNLAINMQRLKSYIKTQGKIIQLYKDYYEKNKNGNQN